MALEFGVGSRVSNFWLGLLRSHHRLFFCPFPLPWPRLDLHPYLEHPHVTERSNIDPALSAFQQAQVAGYLSAADRASLFRRRRVLDLYDASDLDEAARIDGAGYLRIFWQILLPLSGPVLATAAVITFIGDWNAFLFPYIILNDKLKFTIGIGIKYFQTIASNIDSMEPRENLLMAASLMMTTPIIVLFFTAQRYFVRGIVMSGIKG